jgi:hypothetical protein
MMYEIITRYPILAGVDMTKFTLITMVAAILAQPALSVASDRPADSRAKPTSFVPHAHSNSHVYGAPIQQAIVGHSKVSHQKRTPKTRSSSGARRNPK